MKAPISNVGWELLNNPKELSKISNSNGNPIPGSIICVMGNEYTISTDDYRDKIKESQSLVEEINELIRELSSPNQ